MSESLQDVIARAVPAYDELIWPKIQKGQSVLLSAHGNSLRSLAMQRWFR